MQVSKLQNKQLALQMKTYLPFVASRVHFSFNGVICKQFYFVSQTGQPFRLDSSHNRILVNFTIMDVLSGTCDWKDIRSVLYIAGYIRISETENK